MHLYYITLKNKSQHLFIDFSALKLYNYEKKCRKEDNKMPYIHISTNSELAEANEIEIKKALGKAIEAIPGKSEGWLMVKMDNCFPMYFKGSSDWCAMFDVAIFGKASDEAYDELTRRLCEISEKYISVPAERTYVKYSEIEHWGWNNMNF